MVIVENKLFYRRSQASEDCCVDEIHAGQTYHGNSIQNNAMLGILSALKGSHVR